MTGSELLAAYAKGQRTFVGAVLRGADLSGADLSGADLRHADLRHADLRHADLCGAVLRHADLRHADLSGAVLRDADLRHADLSGAVLRGAVLSNADLSGAVLRGAVLSDADLRHADLSGADLSGATLPPFQIVPDAGAFRGWKKLKGNLLAEVEIPDDAPRTSSLIGRKCRAAWVTVRGIQNAAGEAVPVGCGLYDRTEYRVGLTIMADDWDDDIRVECSNGIHFFITMQEARDYIG